MWILGTADTAICSESMFLPGRKSAGIACLALGKTVLFSALGWPKLPKDVFEGVGNRAKHALML
jgi:hypothetical protein